MGHGQGMTVRLHRRLTRLGVATVAFGATLAILTAAGVEVAGTDTTTDSTLAPVEVPAPEPPSTQPPATEPSTTTTTTSPPDAGASIAAESRSGNQISIQANPGAIWTTDVSCGGVNVNQFDDKPDVFLNGGPQGGGPGLPDGNYYVQVTTPDGTVLGKTLAATAVVSGGNFLVCYQLTAILYSAGSGFAVLGYDDTTNDGGEYKVWVSMDPSFPGGTTKTDNFKVLFDTVTTTEVHDPSHTDTTNGSLTAGTLVHDQATVTGGASDPSGGVTFELFTNGGCDGTATSTQVVTLDANGEAESSAFAPVAGSWSYLVTYAGNGTHLGSVAECEPFEVTEDDIDELEPSVNTEVHGPTHVDVTNSTVAFGTTVHDQATVSGTGPTPTGAVSFDIYDTESCGGSPASTEGPYALSGGVVESADKANLAVGGYGYIAHYGGDANYLPSDGECEPFSVIEVSGDITVSLHISKEVIGNIAPPEGTTFTVHVSCTGDATINTDLTFTYSNAVAVQSVTAQIPSLGSVTCDVTETDDGGLTLQGYKIDGGAIQQSASSIVLSLQRTSATVVVVNDPGEVGGVSVSTLPLTGSQTNWLMVFAITLVAVGGVLILLGRPRRA